MLNRPRILWLVPLLAALVYLNTIPASFTLDDLEIVERNPLTESIGQLGRIFATDYWAAYEYADHGLYRPLTIATYALQRTLHGASPAPFHAVNVLLHALASGALALVVAQLFGNGRIAFVTGALFAVHPVHTEAVAGIVGRAEILAFLGTATCLLAYLRATVDPGAKVRLWAPLCVLGYAVGTFSKEIGFLAPATILLTEAVLPSRRRLLRGDRRALAIFGALAVVAILFLWLRSRAIGDHGVSAALAGLTTIERVSTAIRVGLEYLGLLLAPVRLSADYWVGDVPIARSLADPGPLAALAAFAGLAVLAGRFRRTHPELLWGLGFFALTLFPVSNLAFPIGVLKAERILYTPSAGFLVMAAAAIVALHDAARWRTFAVAVLAIALVALSARTWLRNGVWRDPCTLARATVETSPGSPIFLTGVARCLMEEGSLDEAREYLRRAFDSRPDFSTALLVSGILERKAGDLQASAQALERLLSTRPDHTVALENYAAVTYALERWDPCLRALERLRELRPGEPFAYAYLAAVRQRTGDLPGALEVAREGVRLFPDHEDLRRNAALLEELAEREALR